MNWGQALKLAGDEMNAELARTINVLRAVERERDRYRAENERLARRLAEVEGRDREETRAALEEYG